MTDRQLKLTILRGALDHLAYWGYKSFVCNAIVVAAVAHRQITNPALDARQFDSVVDHEWVIYNLDEEDLRYARCVREMHRAITAMLGGRTTYEQWLMEVHDAHELQESYLYVSRKAWINHMIEVAEKEIEND